MRFNESVVLKQISETTTDFINNICYDWKPQTEDIVYSKKNNIFTSIIVRKNSNAISIYVDPKSNAFEILYWARYCLSSLIKYLIIETKDGIELEKSDLIPIANIQNKKCYIPGLFIDWSD